jgi:hypothetical protein
MQHRHRPVTNVVPTNRRKPATNASVTVESTGYWTDSTRDLRSGLDVVELSATRQWADTAILDDMIPVRST